MSTLAHQPHQPGAQRRSSVRHSLARRQRARRALVLLSLLLFPITLNFLSPYLIVLGAANGVVSGSMLLFATLFVSSLFLGRLWCGWVCPGAGMAELAGLVNPDAFTSRRAGRVKWLIWAPWLALIAGMAINAGGFHAIVPMYMTDSGVSVDEPAKFVVYFAVVGLFIGLAVAFGRRAGCHTICWMAPFMMLGRAIRNRLGLPGLQLVTDPTGCTKCETCTGACPMSLPVSTLVQSGRIEHPECVLCGTCADGCRARVIRFAVARGKQPANPA